MDHGNASLEPVTGALQLKPKNCGCRVNRQPQFRVSGRVAGVPLDPIQRILYESAVPLNRMIRPSAMITTPQVTPRMMVKRFRLRSATPEELSPELMPPPNISDSPPPRPLCRRIS